MDIVNSLWKLFPALCYGSYSAIPIQVFQLQETILVLVLNPSRADNTNRGSGDAITSTCLLPCSADAATLTPGDRRLLAPGQAAAAGLDLNRRCLDAAGLERCDWYRLCERRWVEHAMAAAAWSLSREAGNGEGWIQ